MIRSFAVSPILTMLLTVAVVAEVRAIVSGPSSVKPGSLVTLQADQSGADAFAWVFVQPADIEHRQINQNRELVFASGCRPGTTYSVVLIGISLVSGKAEVATTTFSVTVEGDIPEPDPPPDPQPSPDGRFGLTRLARQWASQIAPPAQQKSGALAANFEAVASAIAAGAFSSVEAALDALRKRNQLSLGSDIEIWRPFFVKLAEKQDQLYETGELRNLPDYAEAFREVSRGLRGVHPESTR